MEDHIEDDALLTCKGLFYGALLSVPLWLAIIAIFLHFFS